MEPAANVAEVAIAGGIRTDVAFFGTEHARAIRERGLAADLVVANNLFAHIPALNDFTAGLAAVLKP